MSLGFFASTIALGAFAAAMIYSALQDVLTMTIPDRLVIAMVSAYPILALLAGWPMETIAAGMAAALLVLFIGIGLFALGVLGGGDGKLIAAAVLWVGPDRAIDFIFYTAVMGGICAALLLVFRRWTLPKSWTRAPWIARLHAPDCGIPYAVAIGFGGLAVLPDTAWTRAFA